MDPVLALYRVLCGLSVVLGMVPLPLHVKHGNYAAVSLIAWLALSNLASLLNSFFWPDDAATMHGWDGRGYCDVQVKLLLGAFAGTIGSIAALARSVAAILSPDEMRIFRTQRAIRAGRIKGLVLCVGLPAGVMAAHYVVQPNRYYLTTVSGCTPTVFPGWPAIVLLFVWPPISALFAGYYGCVVLGRLARYRKRVTSLLGSNAPQTSMGRFARLAVLALALVLLYVPAAFFTLSINLNHQFYPYSWAAVHDVDAWRLDAIPRNPAVAARSGQSGRFAVDRCLAIGAGLLIFAVFGVGREALAPYCGWAAALGGLARRLVVLPANLWASGRKRADDAVQECELENCSSGCSSSELSSVKTI